MKKPSSATERGRGQGQGRGRESTTLLDFPIPDRPSFAHHSLVGVPPMRDCLGDEKETSVEFESVVDSRPSTSTSQRNRFETAKAFGDEHWQQP
eukprot:m.62971 g.62971  ORF g.62971 m.62971 type:complete len:94 (+) comp19414_c2_seq2:181-462(+)